MSIDLGDMPGEPLCVRHSRTRRDLLAFGTLVERRYLAKGGLEGNVSPGPEPLLSGWDAVVVIERGGHVVAGCAVALEAQDRPLQTVAIFNPTLPATRGRWFEVGRLVSTVPQHWHEVLRLLVFGVDSYLTEVEPGREHHLLCSTRPALLRLLRQDLELGELATAPPSEFTGPIAPFLRRCKVVHAPWANIVDEATSIGT